MTNSASAAALTNNTSAAILAHTTSAAALANRTSAGALANSTSGVEAERGNSMAAAATQKADSGNQTDPWVAMMDAADKKVAEDRAAKDAENRHRKNL